MGELLSNDALEFPKPIVAPDDSTQLAGIYTTAGEQVAMIWGCSVTAIPMSQEEYPNGQHVHPFITCTISKNASGIVW